MYLPMLIPYWMRAGAMIGLDTGFFIELLRGAPRAIAIWRKLMEGEEEAAVSCLTLFEIQRLALKGAISGSEVLINGIEAVCRLVWIMSPRLLSQAARMSEGLQIPAFDSIILVGLLSNGVTAVYTKDPHFESYRKKGVQVIRI